MMHQSKFAVVLYLECKAKMWWMMTETASNWACLTIHRLKKEIYFAIDIEQLGNDQRGEGNADYIGERLFETDHSSQHYGTSLIKVKQYSYLEDRFPNPDQEGLVRQSSAFLEGFVKGWKFHSSFDWNILIKDKGEHW